MLDTHTTYEQTISYLFRQLPMFQREGAAAFKKDLTNIKALCDHLGNPEDQFNSIHIAGTNGKGSIAHLIACLFQMRGLKVGLYTSPHYTDFRERIKIDGQYISEEAVIDFVNTQQSFFETLQPSFFEISVAMAFDYFAKEEVDIAIVETGLGGRLDSTNILTPDLCVITNISLDHQDMLGNSLEEIATEKAGIIKAGVPVVIGETQEAVKAIFLNKAKEVGAPIVFAEDRYRAEESKRYGEDTTYTIYREDKACYNDVRINVAGAYQEKNVTTLFQCIESINDLDLFQMIREYDIRNGLPQLKELTQYKGRWQLLSESPNIICDSAHNESGLQYAMKELMALEYDNLHIVMGMVNDKEVEKMLTLFPTEAQYYFCKADIPRGLDADVLKEKAKKFQLEGEYYPSVAEALAEAKKAALKKDVIYVGGSTFVVAEVV